ncbi:TetR/AcrR family transcriptional regulator [Nocardioides plantarum]|uniref:TetR/AcrR family transcriptional regulator n=1 Tax=Nocardioides plantarum TaxID=29299 RepID=A0ABV5KE22_9ACTN|nr:TetR/AcrR family transcriptional regulator [Nocardioides plantarum]
MATRARTEVRLLDAAEELLFTDGVVATSVDAILERAGVSPATLYRAYGSKEGLVAAALERRHGEWLAVWDAELQRSEDDRARLLSVFVALERFRSRPDGARWCAFLGTAAECARPSPVLAATLATETGTLRTRLRDLAVPLVGPGSSELAESLLLVVSGELAMRLRDGVSPGGVGGGVARAVAETLVDHAITGPAGAARAAAAPAADSSR